MHLFHKFSYFQINTFKKWTIGCCPGFYLNFGISAFDSCSYHHHHTQTPEMCNASFKSYLTFCPRQETWDPLHISTGFYKMLKKSTTPSPPTNVFKLNTIQKKKKEKNQRVYSMEPLIFLIWCHQVIRLLAFCGVNWFASTSSALLASYHSSTRFPSSKNVLTSFVVSSLLLVILKHLFFLNPLFE